MARFSVVSKNKVDIDKKPRVYFTCHPKDFEKHFNSICNDIFKMHDCAIYYTEDMTEVIEGNNKATDLGRNNLFVVPVTFNLLTTPNRAMDEDIPYAIKEHIPVLPFMMEQGIDEFYSQPDKFHELQYLNPYSTDLTAISYEKKLKKYLDSVLISDELANRVRAAFDAYIFLSYRKKDRKYANELMRLIHSNPECRDIAIWFDEFLTPGESFKENIERILDDCKLFTLLVTPQLLEKVVDEDGEERENYVVSTELPLARKKKLEKGTDIFAVEMEKTDRVALSKININDYINSSDKDFHERLLNVVSRIAVTTNDIPEHNFLIGLAYLEGIDVEIDRNRGLQLITMASEAGLLEATKKLRDMYHDGIAVERNYNIALKLCEKAIELCENKADIDLLETIAAYEELAYLYYEIDEYQKAVPFLKKAYILKAQLLGEKNSDVLETMKNYAVGCYLAGVNYFSHEKQKGKFYFTFGRSELVEESISMFEKIYLIQLDSKLESAESLLTLCYLALVCGDNKEKAALAEDYRQKAYKKVKCMSVFSREYIDCLLVLAASYRRVDFGKTLQLNRMAYVLSGNVWGLDNLKTVQTLEKLADLYSDIAYHKHSENDEYKKTEEDEYRREAVKLFEEVYSYKSKLLGENHIGTLNTLDKLSTIYWYLDEHKLQFETLKKIYECQRVVFGSNDTRTLRTLELMADTLYVVGGEYKEEIKLVEEIYDMRCEIYGEKHPDSIIALRRVAKTYDDYNNFDTAVFLYDKIFSLSSEVFGNDSMDVILSLEDLVKCYYQYGKYDKALIICQKVINIENNNQNCPLTYKKGTMSLMAKIYYRLNRREEAFAICDKLQKNENIPSLVADDIAYIRNLELEKFIEKIESYENPNEFICDCDFFKCFLKTLVHIEELQDDEISLREFNLIRAIIYERIAYYCMNLKNYDTAKLFYSLVVIILLVEARNSLIPELYDASIKYLGEFARFCKKYSNKDEAKIHYDLQLLMKAERKKIKYSQSDSSVIKEKEHNKMVNIDCLSMEAQDELKKIFDELFDMLANDEDEVEYSDWVFDKEYEETLIKSVLEKIFKLSFASSLAKNDLNDEKEIILTRKKGCEESYRIVDLLTLNNEKILLLKRTTESGILIIVSNKNDAKDNDNNYLPFSVDEFLKSLDRFI